MKYYFNMVLGFLFFDKEKNLLRGHLIERYQAILSRGTVCISLLKDKKFKQQFYCVKINIIEKSVLFKVVLNGTPGCLVRSFYSYFFKFLSHKQASLHQRDV